MQCLICMSAKHVAAPHTMRLVWPGIKAAACKGKGCTGTLGGPTEGAAWACYSLTEVTAYDRPTFNFSV
jgi:hypothetical protein